MLRASKCFNKQGIEVVQFPVDRISGSRKFHLEHLILPQAETLQKWQVFIHEMVGICVYKIKGYV